MMMQSIWVESQSQIRPEGTQRMALAILNAGPGGGGGGVHIP